MKSMT